MIVHLNISLLIISLLIFKYLYRVIVLEIY